MRDSDGSVNRERLADEFRRLIDGMEVGGTKNNGTARQELGLREESGDDIAAYWDTRDTMVDEARIRRVRGGPGASFERLPSDEGLNGNQEGALPLPPEDSDNDDQDKEEDYYPEIKRVLTTEWVRDEKSIEGFVEQTARKGRTQLDDWSNDWTRPDFTAVLVHDLQTLNTVEIEVVTFEVKIGYQRKGLYEALSHARRAHRAYVLLVHDDPVSDQPGFFQEAYELGVGVLLVREAGDYLKWDERVPPKVRNPQTYLVDNFLQEMTTLELRQKIKGATGEQIARQIRDRL